MIDVFEGDVVLHQDADLPETVESVEKMLTTYGFAVIYLRTSRRFRPASEFTRTALKVLP